MQAGSFTHRYKVLSRFRCIGLFLTLISISAAFAGMGIAGPAGDLYVKLNGEQTSRPAAVVFYSLRVGNNGPGFSGSHKTRIEIPAAFTNVQLMPSTPAKKCIQQEKPDGVTIRCSSASIDNAESYTIKIAANAPVELGRYMLNGYVSRTIGRDPNRRNDHAALFTTIQPPLLKAADLSISMKSISEKVLIGDVFEYLLTILNRGPASAVDTKISMQVPFSSEFISIISSQGRCASPPNAGGLSVLSCSLGDLKNDDMVTVTVKLRAPLKAGMVVGQAAILSETADPDSTNNNTTSTTQVNNKTTLIPCFSFFGLFGY